MGVPAKNTVAEHSPLKALNKGYSDKKQQPRTAHQRRQSERIEMEQQQKNRLETVDYKNDPGFTPDLMSVQPSPLNLIQSLLYHYNVRSS